MGMSYTDYLNSASGPVSSSFGSGLYDFGYDQSQPLPPAEAASTASQLESGGSGVSWDFGSGVGNLLQDITKAWITVQDHKNAPSLPTGYARAPDGSIYAVDPAYRNMAPTVGGTLNQIPISFLLIGGMVFLALTMGHD